MNDLSFAQSCVMLHGPDHNGMPLLRSLRHGEMQTLQGEDYAQEDLVEAAGCSRLGMHDLCVQHLCGVP